VGNSSYQPMREVNGLTGAAPIWHQFMRTVLTGQPEYSFIQPPGFVRQEICALSGLLPTPICPYRHWEWFIEGTQPTQLDTFYRKVQIDAATGRLANESTPPERQKDQIVLDLPSQLQPWAHAEGLTLLSDLIASSSDGNDQASSPPLRLISPSSGSIYKLATGLDTETQKLLLEAVSDVDLKQVTIWVDGDPVGSFENTPYQAWWPLTVGRHEAWAEGLLEDGTNVVSEYVIFNVEE
jgi:membrane carboxypeptidase/penicillin-binding protein PbpC